VGDVVEGGLGEAEEGLETEAGRSGDPLDLAEEGDDMVRGDARGRV